MTCQTYVNASIIDTWYTFQYLHFGWRNRGWEEMLHRWSTVNGWRHHPITLLSSAKLVQRWNSVILASLSKMEKEKATMVKGRICGFQGVTTRRSCSMRPLTENNDDQLLASLEGSNTSIMGNLAKTCAKSVQKPLPPSFSTPSILLWQKVRLNFLNQVNLTRFSSFKLGSYFRKKLLKNSWKFFNVLAMQSFHFNENFFTKKNLFNFFLIFFSFFFRLFWSVQKIERCQERHGWICKIIFFFWKKEQFNSQKVVVAKEPMP